MNKWFAWDFILKSISGDNVAEFYKLKEYKLQDILDYLVVCKQESKITKWKESKNLLPL